MLNHQMTGPEQRFVNRVSRVDPAFVLLLALSFLPINSFAVAHPLPTLTRAEQVRQLTPEQAALGYPVRIRGVITMDAPAPDFFIQDSSAGIYVEGSVVTKYVHRLADLVEVVGITGPGKFAPVIREQKLHMIGKGILPKSPLLAFSDLADGRQDSQWARIRGIVRSVAVDRTSWSETTIAMEIASGRGEFTVRVPIAHEQDLSSWIDSAVEVEGVCGSLYNTNRQLTGILFYVPRLNFVKVEAPPREVSVSDLLRFAPGQRIGHRVRVHGVVEYQQPGHALFLQSVGQGLRVLSEQDTAVAIGDVVEATGFPVMGESAPQLEDAVFRRIGRDKPPASVPLEEAKPWEQYDGALVTIDAKLLSRHLQPEGLQLSMQHGSVFFEATLSPGVPAGPLLSIPINSDVRVVGICLVRNGGLWSVPQSFRMLLRFPQDVMVLRKPSWWNLTHTVWLLGVISVILLAAMAWVIVLGRRLREQMAVIRQKLRNSAVLEERNRIAREFHDTLEQELVGITMQLDLAVDCFRRAPRVAAQALETARNMSRHSMIEARRSVWDLRCQLLEEGDLIHALAHVIEPLNRRDGIKIDSTFRGVPVRLPRTVEMNLLRIGQEAVANATKHGRAQHISVELLYTVDSVCLRVSDDGQGFAADEVSSSGHFGLLDMRERAQSMGSELKIDSVAGRGTHVSVEVLIGSQQKVDDAIKTNSYSSG